MAFTTNNGVRLHWQEQGSGDPLLLVMGHAFTGDLWYPVIPTLSKTRRVIWFDNRGTGQSGMTRTAEISDYVQDSLAVMDAAGVTQADVFGVSMGGGIVMQLALDAPERVRRLVLGCTAIKSESMPPSNKRSNLGYYVPLKFAAKIMGRKAGTQLYGPACPPEAAAKDIAVLASMKISPRGLIAQKRAIERYTLTLEKAATITAPSLVLHGNADGTVPIALGKQIAETLPNARFIEYDGAGHNFLVPYQDKVLADVESFLSMEIASAAAGG